MAEWIDSGKVDGDCVPIDPGSHFLAGDHQIRRSPLVSMCGLLLAPPAFPSPSTPPAMSIQPCLHVQGHCECPAASAQESPVACLWCLDCELGAKPPGVAARQKRAGRQSLNWIGECKDRRECIVVVSHRPPPLKEANSQIKSTNKTARSRCRVRRASPGGRRPGKTTGTPCYTWQISPEDDRRPVRQALDI